MELRFNVPDGQIQILQERTQMASAADTARDALALHDWATAQAQAGKRIFAVDPSGGLEGPFLTPGLSHAQNPQRW